MSAKIQLTRHAIMYISVGFAQPCLLQVLTHRLAPDSSIEMIVYDGTVYAGALYRTPTLHRLTGSSSRPGDPSKDTDFSEELSTVETTPQDYDVVWVKAVQICKNQPLEVQQLRIVHTGLTHMLGREILSLTQFMRNRKFSSFADLEEVEGPPQASRKKIKLNQQPKDATIHQPVLSQKSSEINFEEKAINPIEMETRQKEVSSTCLIGEKGPEQRQNEISEAKDLLPKQPVHCQTEKVRKSDQGQPQNSASARQLVEEIVEGKKALKVESIASKPKEIRKFEPMIEDDNEVTEVKATGTRKSRVIDLVGESEPVTMKSPLARPSKESYLMIQDLYERMHRFSILCRINHIIHFTTQKGNHCTKLMLVDRNGDEILCVLYDKSKIYQNNGPELLKGRTYIFENGDVEKDQSGYLSISIPWSGIAPTKTVLQSFNPERMKRVADIENIESGHFLSRAVGGSSSKSINNRRAFTKEVHVCGILRRVKEECKLVNNQFRVVSALCDPENSKSITFVLFMDELVSFPSSGSVVSLHNMRVAEFEGTFRLENTKRSYYLVEDHNHHQYFADLRESSRRQTWKLKAYKNISEVTYVRRNIASLKELLTNTFEHGQCHSELDCNIASIIQKKEFSACATCHHETKPTKGLQTYCYYCKKIEKWNKRFVFSAEVADSTGSLDVTFFSSEMQAFVNMGAQGYGNLAQEERRTMLELSCFQNVLLQVRSEKVVGGSSHFVTRADKISHKRTLENIKENLIESKTKYPSAW